MLTHHSQGAPQAASASQLSRGSVSLVARLMQPPQPRPCPACAPIDHWGAGEQILKEIENFAKSPRVPDDIGDTLMRVVGFFRGDGSRCRHAERSRLHPVRLAPVHGLPGQRRQPHRHGMGVRRPIPCGVPAATSTSSSPPWAPAVSSVRQRHACTGSTSTTGQTAALQRHQRRRPGTVSTSQHRRWHRRRPARGQREHRRDSVASAVTTSDRQVFNVR